ncbi:MAG TPA: sigma-54 dependent transcriptional regulator [Acidobacteriaceae bacterium]|jgi:DNA-binding NtrC family response regulator|nr:sigma-54 dependent transcriptional regulator [Acidobacteriaceae bacterium]
MSASFAPDVYERSDVMPEESPRLYVLDSNPDVLDYLRRTLDAEYALSLFMEEEPLLEQLNNAPPPALILLEWESMEKSLAVLSHIRSTLPDVPIVMLSCTAEVKDLEVVTRVGARGIVLKPFLDGNLEAAIEEQLAAAQRTIPAEPQEIPLDETHSFVRSSKRMCELQAQAVLVARSDIPVLILGESGTGKEILALYTHKMSNRAHRMFLKVNCAAMPADLLESELFGYEQGAFTGAVKTKPGKFEICTGGTIFLDEIGEMPGVLQAKLLQVLQDGTFSRLGSRSMMRVDVRVIAATNINMKAAIAAKSFREDLYYRLNGFSLSIPPLCERREEIPLLANYFMRKVAKRYDRKPLPLSAGLLEAFSRYAWPGNLREMENVINRYLILGDERPILAEMSPYAAFRSESNGNLEMVDGAGLKQIVRSLKGEAEASAIAQMLESKGWNRKAAASELQISYKALLYKIKQYELAPKRA